MTPSESWEPTNLLKAVRRARRFPENTCPASRHFQLIAEGLLTRKGYPMLAEDPKHCATSMLASVANLYNARSRSGKLREALFSLHDICLRMDCEHQADRPTEREYQAAMKMAAANLTPNVQV